MIKHLVIEWANGDLEVYRDGQVEVEQETDLDFRDWAVDKIWPIPKHIATVHLGDGVKKSGPIKEITVYYSKDK